MNRHGYYRTYSCHYVPGGYELVEKDEHKKERLESEQELLKAKIDILTNSIVESEKRLKDVNEELKELKE